MRLIMVTFPLPNAQIMTFAEFLDWKPETSRYELHDGTPIEMHPLGKHEEIKGFLTIQIAIEVGRRQLPYLLPNQALIKLPDRETQPPLATAYLPDVVLVDRPSLADEPLWERASTLIRGSSIPLVIEVVSTNWRDDYAKKLVDYESLGIVEYWIVDYLGMGGRRYIGTPKQPTISVYQLVDEEYQVSQFRGDNAVASALFPDLKLTAAQIFNASL